MRLHSKHTRSKGNPELLLNAFGAMQAPLLHQNAKRALFSVCLLGQQKSPICLIDSFAVIGQCVWDFHCLWEQ